MRFGLITEAFSKNYCFKKKIRNVNFYNQKISDRKMKWNNHIRLICLIFALMFLNAGTGAVYAGKPDAPGVSASPNRKSYSPGESGYVTLTFKTGSHVKIPKDPEITVTLTGSDVEAGGLQDYSGGEGDYISGSKVKYNFTVPGDAASGSTLTISGDVRFGYCSSSDGVCKIGTRSFTAKIKVK